MTASHARIRKHILHHFPRVSAIDLKRFPSVPSVKKAMIEVGFRDACYHVVHHDEGYVSTNEYLARVRNKFISTLTLLSEEAFQRGFNIFRLRVRKKYGPRTRQASEFVFVVGQK